MNKLFNKKIMLLLPCLMIILAGQAFSDSTCNSYIANNSSDIWIIRFNPTEGAKVEYISTASGCNNSLPTCEISPGEVVDIEIPKSAQLSGELILTSGKSNVSKSIIYDNYSAPYSCNFNYRNADKIQNTVLFNAYLHDANGKPVGDPGMQIIDDSF